jgi:hypothetical protein
MTVKRQDVIDTIINKQNERVGIRREERQVSKAEKTMGYVMEGVGETRSDAQKTHDLLRSFILEHLIPTNVGELSKTLWPKWYQVDFTAQDSAIFGMNPVVKPLDVFKKSFRTVQDAGYLLLGITRNFNTHGTAGKGAPWEVVLRDNQSSRQVNSHPLPVQSMGHSSILTKLVTPYYFLPNSSFGVELSTFIENDMALVGDGSQFFTFYGLEVRSAEVEYILHTVYSEK